MANRKKIKHPSQCKAQFARTVKRIGRWRGKDPDKYVKYVKKKKKRDPDASLKFIMELTKDKFDYIKRQTERIFTNKHKKKKVWKKQK